MPYKPLSSTFPGESAYIHELYSSSGIRRRILDMGLTENALVTCLYRSPAGDPTAYLIRGAVIALRQEDAAGIIVRTR